MNIIEYLNQDNLERIALVGTNSQGKTYALDQFSKRTEVKNCSISVWSEVKADEGIKNSADSTTLISWLNRLIDMSDLKTKIDEKINSLDFTSINTNNSINVGLKNDFTSYKGVVSAEISTSSNSFGKPGSGEKFLGQLYLISKILDDNTDDYYKYLIVDEPERHLHPSLYLKMATTLNKISKHGIKVIISTHSPIIVKYFVEDTNEIIKVKNGELQFLPRKSQLIELRNGFNVYTDPNFQFGSYTRISNQATEYFYAFILDIVYKSLFADIVVIGEGHAEKEIMELYFEKYSADSQTSNQISVTVFGKCFYPWIISILGAINLKTLSVYDVDNIGNEKHQNLNRIISNLSNAVLPISPNIEALLGLDPQNDKVKDNIIEIRSRYINNDAQILSVLDSIHNLLFEL